MFMFRLRFQLGSFLLSLIISPPCSSAHLGMWGKMQQMERGAHAKEVSDWLLHKRVEADQVIHPIFMLRHSRKQLAEFEQTLWDVSTPGHLQYGQHLSRTEVAAQLPTIPGARQAVISWLNHHGINEIFVSSTGDMIEASITAEVAESIFSTALHYFQHSTGVSVIRAGTPYSVPEQIAQYLYVVGNLAHLPHLKRRPQVPALLEKSETSAEDASLWQSCAGCPTGTVQPAVLEKTYRFDPPWYPDAVVQKTSMAVAAFQGISFDDPDLKLFQVSCHLNTSVEVNTTIGSQDPEMCSYFTTMCIEALLDIQVIKAVGGAIPLIVVSSHEYSYLKWIQEFDNLDDLPHAISISYGMDEIQEESTEYMDAVNAQFMKLGARGASVLVASGDMGTLGRTGYWGTDRFRPDFPASSPYVTSVGGTDFLEDGVIGEEKAWSGSGGGFSNQFPAPPYQLEAIDTFVNRSREAGTLPDQFKWNPEGRGYPDIAALGGSQNAYCITGGSRAMGVAGTSASTPMVAGLIARLNALRIEEGASPLGFLNPFIYQNMAAFNDVKVGDNSDGWGPEWGFQAVRGWDPTTGAGTPNFQKLRVAAMAAIARGTVTEQQAAKPLFINIFLLLGCITAVLAFTFSRVLCQQPTLPMEEYLIME